MRERRETPGFGPWSVKSGVVHVEPPASVLASMITLRLHLDDCGAENGPLRVLPGSHAQGVLDDGAIEIWRSSARDVACVCGAGDLLVMRPLLLHASSEATSPAHRRVVHIEYAAGDLPNGLQWQCG